MRLIFVNRFYWPETPATGQLLTDLAEALARRGDEVTVITSHSSDSERPATETRAGVTIRRVRSTQWMKAGIAGKAVDFATFYLGAIWRLLHLARRETVVVAMTDPPLLGIGAWLVARVRGARLIHWVQDIYPELAIKLTGQGWLSVLRPVRNLSWRRADDCVTLGTDMAGVLAAAGVATTKIVLIPNWAPEGVSAVPFADASALRLAWGLNGKFVVGYSGNLGRVHDLDPVLSVAEVLRDDPSIAFVFVGGGAQRAALEASVAHRGLENIQFQPVQPRDRLAESLGVADIHLVTVFPGCERFVFPSKLYGIAAVGRPVLFIGPGGSEVARLVTDKNLGVARPREDVAGIAASIRRLAASRAESQHHAEAALRFAAENDVAAAVAQWSARFDALNACRPGATADTKLSAR